MQLALKPPDRFTYGLYRQWPDEERWELLHGEAYAMTAPSRLHQEIVFELAGQIRNYLQGKPCKGYVAPFDVRLPEIDEADDDTSNVVQPDLVVVCDSSKLDDKGCRGAPDWVIEVLSPSTALLDLEGKRKLYEAHGVREYWVVHPSEHWGMQYRLTESGQYAPMTVFALRETTPVSIFADLAVDWSFLAAESNGVA